MTCLNLNTIIFAMGILSGASFTDEPGQFVGVPGEYEVRFVTATGYQRYFLKRIAGETYYCPLLPITDKGVQV